MPATEPTSVRFANVVRSLTAAARAEGLRPPSFRSPPSVDAVRSVRRRLDGTALVSVALQDRPWAAVLADMVEGVVVANRLRGPAAERARAVLWRAVGDAAHVAA